VGIKQDEWLHESLAATAAARQAHAWQCIELAVMRGANATDLTLVGHAERQSSMNVRHRSAL